MIRSYLNARHYSNNEGVLYLDTTYKLSLDGYKLTIIATHDRMHKVQPILFAITFYERSTVYEFAI